LDFVVKSAVILTDNFGSFKTCLVSFNPGSYLLNVFTVSNTFHAFFWSGYSKLSKKGKFDKLNQQELLKIFVQL